jgi:hypothetical protein
MRATLRSLSRRDEVKAMLAAGGVTDAADFEFIEADLANDKNWPEAVAGVKRVVLTSASGAVLAGHKSYPGLFTEEEQRRIRLTFPATSTHTSAQRRWRNARRGSSPRRKSWRFQRFCPWR